MNASVEITRARHAWPEEKGFMINRPKGIKEYTFLRFHGGVQLKTGDSVEAVSPGTCIFYDIDTPQWFQSPGPLVHDWMHMVGNVPQLLAAAGLELNKPYHPGNGQFVTAIIREIELELLSGRVDNPLPELKFREMLIKLARELGRESAEGPLKPAVKAQLRQVRSQIFAHLDRTWTVKEMAELAYISPSRFHTVYKTAFGIAPMDDLIHARIDTAKNRLCNSEETISRLASDLGYRSVTHFCRQFKKITGVTPMQFRKNLEE